MFHWPASYAHTLMMITAHSVHLTCSQYMGHIQNSSLARLKLEPGAFLYVEVLSSFREAVTLKNPLLCPLFWLRG